MLLGLLTLVPKLLYYAGTPVDIRARQEAEVADFLARRGWAAAGVLELNVAGDLRAIRYQSASCSGDLSVAVLPSSGEATVLTKELLTTHARLFFVYDGVLTDAPPHYAYIKQKLGRLSESLHVSLFRRAPYLAVATSADCAPALSIPWQQL
jgi:hypothetical protein